MQQHKWIPQNVSMTPSIWNLDQAKLIYGDRGQNSDYLWAGGCCSNWRKGTQETSVMETFYLLIQVVITWVKVFEICELCAWVYVCSVIPDFLWPLWSPIGSSVHGIFQAQIPEWVAISSSRGSSQSRVWIHALYISYIGRQILYLCATWEAPILSGSGWFISMYSKKYHNSVK